MKGNKAQKAGRSMTGTKLTGASNKNSDANIMKGMKAQMKKDGMPYHKGAYTGSLPPTDAGKGPKE